MRKVENAFLGSEDSGITGALIRFVRFLRNKGFHLGIQETFDSIHCSLEGLLNDKRSFFYGLRSLYCTSEEEFLAFEANFREFWDKPKQLKEVPGKKTIPNQQHLRKPEGSLVMLGSKKDSEGEDHSKTVTGANSVERLQNTDFALISEVESQMLEKLADLLWKQMAKRLKRRLRRKNEMEQVDLRNTIRRNISSGGEPIDLMFKGRKRRRPKLIVLLDVSGSMDKYSFYLLRFIWALKGTFSSVETFIFSTKLLRITDLLKGRKLESSLKKLTEQADHWSGGTRIGECLQTFNRDFAARIMTGFNYTLVLSDGLDTGEPLELAYELKKLKLRTHKLIWLNPLKGSANYEPSARGMYAAVPFIDEFKSAHNLKSLLELEKTFVNV